MARRELPEINAGSMADIAFLLLVFFLMVTTMSKESGLERTLPPPVQSDVEPFVFQDRDVFKVLVNFKNDLLVEDTPMQISELRQAAREFLVANGDNILNTLESEKEGLPIRAIRDTLSVVDRGVKDYEEKIVTANKELGSISEKFDGASDEELIVLSEEIDSKEDEIKSLEKNRDKLLSKSYALGYFGSYASLPNQAIITVINDNGTNYETYVLVNNELEGALNDLRDELCLAKFDKTYGELDIEDPEDKKKILATRVVYPQRISEAEPLDVNGFSDDN